MSLEFVVLGGMRTGSTLLSTTLDEHPAVQCMTEPFFDMPQGVPRQQYLAKHVYVPQAGEARAVGCKLVYSSLDRATRSWLEARTGLQVIHLLRNPVASLVSLMQARDTGIYHLVPEAARLRARNPKGTRTRPWPLKSFSIDPATCERFVHYILRMRESVRRSFPGANYVEVGYDDLVRDSEEGLRSVQQLLRVDYRPLSVQDYRIDGRPLSERIANHAELRSRVAPECLRWFD